MSAFEGWRLIVSTGSGRSSLGPAEALLSQSHMPHILWKTAYCCPHQGRFKGRVLWIEIDMSRGYILKLVLSVTCV